VNASAKINHFFDIFWIEIGKKMRKNLKIVKKCWRVRVGGLRGVEIDRNLQD